MSPAIKAARETVAIKGVFDNQKGGGGVLNLEDCNVFKSRRTVRPFLRRP